MINKKASKKNLLAFLFAYPLTNISTTEIRKNSK
jgi:hypothetical protein